MSTSAGNPRTRRQNFILIVTLGLLNALTPFSIDMYLPSFSEIAREFAVPPAQVALSVSVYFIGFALGQLFYGPLLDRFGRKKPVLFGLALYVLASFGCASASSLNAFLLFRALSALGGCAASVGTLAMVRDYFPPRDSSRIFSMLMLVLSVSPLLAPTVGGLILTIANWRTIFVVLAGVGLLDVFLLLSLPEGQPPNPNVHLRLKPIAAAFREILRHPQFATATFAGSLSFAGLFVYVAGSPAIFMEGFQVSAQVYGFIFAALAAGLIGGGQLNLLLARSFPPARIFRAAVSVQTIFATVFFALVALNLCGLGATILLLFLILSCAGLSGPNANALALEPFSHNAGSASALLGFLQLGIGSLTSAGVGLLEAKGSLPTAAVMFATSALSLSILLLRGSRSLPTASFAAGPPGPSHP